jgi:4-amino-4-deoxy-L-arabinose transferase-like glycosyltransferase
MPEPITQARTTLLCGLAGGAAAAALELPFIGRYGWDRDELYFLSAGRHPALGYVDFPPLTAWIAWLVHAVAGNSLVALRLTCLAAGIGVIVLIALMVRELGGGWRAQLVAALGWALLPVALGSASIFHPTWFDQLAWAAFLYVALRILGRPEPRLWPLLGLVAGIGLQAKYTIAVLLVCFAVALLATPSRRLLATRGPWLAFAVVVLVFLPNLVWQAEHGWPSVHFASSQNAKTAEDTSRAAYLVQGVLFLGVAGAVLAVVGIVWLWRRPRLRPLAIVPVAVTLLFFVERGRSYYPLPGDTLPFAAGIVATGEWLRAGCRVRFAAVGGLVALLLVVLAVAAPLVLPVRSTASMVRAGLWKDTFYKDELGWPELADQAALAWRQLPVGQRDEGIVLAGNYGEASALELYGPARGLPRVVSGHLSWQYWRPKRLDQRFALVVGYDPGSLNQICSSWRTLQQIDNRWHIANEEQGRLIAGCALRRPLGELWKPYIARDVL